MRGKQSRSEQRTPTGQAGPPANMGELLDRLEQARAGKEAVSVKDLLAITGEGSFGALMLVPGLIVFSPLSGIPGLPSVMATLVILFAVQLLVGRQHFWLPAWVCRRRLPATRFDPAIRFMRPIARVLDKLTRQRLTVLTHGIALRVIALACMVLAATMYPLELVPMGNTIAGAAITVLALALLTRDGLLVILAGAVSAGVVAVVWRFLVGG